jgi:L-seryl-tRNA(Ser) seleniumtransferase
MDEQRKEMLKKLPKIDEIILLLEKQDIYSLAPRDIVIATCRTVVQNLREKIIEAKEKDLPKFL